MKILMTKVEFADFIRECCKGSECTKCALYGYCGDGSVEGPEDFIEIVEDADEEQK